MSSIKHKRKQFDPARLATLQYLDAAAVFHVAPIAPRTFYQLVADHKLPAFRIGGTGKLVVRREDLERLLTATPAESHIDKIVDEVMSNLAGKGQGGER